MTNFTVGFAVYGALPGGDSQNAEAYDVTQVLSSILNAPGATGIVVCGNNLKGDPCPGNAKHFGALVNNLYFACLEGQAIDFNYGGGSPPSSNLVVKFAVYGALPNGQQNNAQAFDVTTLVQDIINLSNGTVACNNASFAGDPSPGATKHFAAIVNRDGTDLYFACQEGQTIDFNQGGGSG
jgi:hypothetical protein